MAVRVIMPSMMTMTESPQRKIFLPENTPQFYWVNVTGSMALANALGWTQPFSINEYIDLYDEVARIVRQFQKEHSEAKIKEHPDGVR